MHQFTDSDQDSLRMTQHYVQESLRFPLFFVALLWLIHLHQVVVGWDPGYYGIVARHVVGIRGIFTAPLVHGSWEHLLSNSFPLLVLLFFTQFFYRRVALRAFWLIYMLTGLGVWLFAREVSHIGASGVTYGLVSFLFWSGIFRRSVRAIMLALVIVVLYSGMFAGVLPQQEGISWESHLIGSIIGIFAAFWHKEELEEAEELGRQDPYAEERLQPKEQFLPDDVFEKTKAQRAAEAQAEWERQRIESETQMPYPLLMPPTWTQHNTGTPNP